MTAEHLLTVLSELGGAAEFNAGAFDMLRRYLSRTEQRLEDLTVGELLATVHAVDLDYNRIYSRVQK